VSSGVIVKFPHGLRSILFDPGFGYFSFATFSNLQSKLKFDFDFYDLKLKSK